MLVQRAAARMRRVSLRWCESLASLPARAAHRGLPVPPSRLINLVGGSNDLEWFLHSGRSAAGCIREVLHSNDIPLERLGAILDFGCGAGRVLRYWEGLRTTQVCGTDSNPELVRWTRENLPFADVRENLLEPPLDWPDRSFDFIYALSVFTHLTDALCLAWIEELTRVLAPGGHLLVTTHGDFYRPQLGLRDRQAYDNGQVVARIHGREGSNDFATFHPPACVHDRLAPGLDVVEFRPEGAMGNPRQDLWLFRKPG